MGLFVVLAIINWIVYHKIFNVVYFGNMGMSFIREVIGCFFVAFIEIFIFHSIFG